MSKKKTIVILIEANTLGKREKKKRGSKGEEKGKKGKKGEEKRQVREREKKYLCNSKRGNTLRE